MSSDKRNREITTLIQQLQQLQLQQQCITQRLATLTSTNQIDRVQPPAATVRVATPEPT